MSPDSLYIDSKGRFAIGFFEKEEPMFVDAQQWEGVDRGMVLRVATSLETFDEKIAVLENGLDDIAVERMKFFLANVLRPELKSRYHDLRFIGIKELPGYVDPVECGEMSFMAPAPESGAMMQFHVPMVMYYEHVMACQVDVRMTLPQGFIASNVDSEWMERVMTADPGINFPYYRVKKLKNSEFGLSTVTFRKSAFNPTMRLYGLKNMRNGIVYFPPLFPDIKMLDSEHFCCNNNAGSIIINPMGGTFDVFLRHLPPEPIIDYSEYFTKATEWIFENIKIYKRESAEKVPEVAHYKRGECIRAGVFLEASALVTAPDTASNTTFLILSSHAVPMYEIAEVSDYNAEIDLWKVNIFHYNDIFLVIDNYKYKGLRQVTLLHIPPSIQYFVKSEKDIDLIDNYAKSEPLFDKKSITQFARKHFRDSFKAQPSNAVFNDAWYDRTPELPGLFPNFQRYGLEPIGPPNPEVASFEKLIVKYNRNDEDVIPQFHIEQRKIPSQFL